MRGWEKTENQKFETSSRRTDNKTGSTLPNVYISPKSQPHRLLQCNPEMVSVVFARQSFMRRTSLRPRSVVILHDLALVVD